MSIMRYEPVQVLRQFQDEMNRFFDERPAAGAVDYSRVATSEWTPAVDIKEEAERYVITADVPGVDPKVIDITMENGVLSIKGERTSEAAQERQGYKRVERVSGGFYRRFSLPDTVDSEAISASSSHGVLEVTIPKKQAVKPRRISVS